MASDTDSEEVLTMCAKGKSDQIPNIENLCDDFVPSDLVFIMPCQINQTAYLIRDNQIIETYVEKIINKQTGHFIKLACNKMYETSCNSIGKTVFFDKKKAEKVLRKVDKNGKN